MAAHTPEPWRIDDESIAQVDRARIIRPKQGGYRIAEVYGEWPDIDRPGLANARLIAAAPEMAEVLRFVVDACVRLNDIRACEGAREADALDEELNDMESQAANLLARIEGKG